MTPEYVTFNPHGMPSVWLEGQVLDGGGAPCVVSHPHPLAGGDMEHPVVEALWRAAADAGYRSLRYNFRGVGESSGELTPQSPLPTPDLAGAIAFLGGGPLVAIGYSYGARTTLHGIHAGLAVTRAALVGLPTRTPANRAAMSNLILGRRVRTEQFQPFPDAELAATSPQPVRVFAGSLDPLVEVAEYREHGVEPVLFDGVNHFFSRRLGNQPPHDDDMAALAAAVVTFLLDA